jgi:hypothetical protein
MNSPGEECGLIPPAICFHAFAMFSTNHAQQAGDIVVYQGST